MKTPENKEIVNRILELIEKSGRMDKEIVSATNLSRTSISEWRTGRAFPSTSAVAKLAKYFNVSTDYLIFGIESESVSNTALDPEWREIRKTVNTLPERDRLTCTAYIKGFLEGYKAK